MKYSWFLMLTAVMLLGINTGCSRVQKVAAIEGDLNQPYDSLGTIEVDLKAPRVSYGRILGQAWEWMTFGCSENISREDFLKGLLDKKILKDAKGNYGAEAVIRMRYWPDLTAEKFPQGRIYAKGEMIRYKRFPS